MPSDAALFIEIKFAGLDAWSLLKLLGPVPQACWQHGLLRVPQRSLCGRHAEISHANRALNVSLLNPYIEAFRACGELAACAWDAEHASLRMLALPNVLRCFLLEGNGRQLGGNIALPSRAQNEDKRFLPVSNASDATRSRRPYFQRAVAAPGQVQISRPHLSIADARMCVTLSIMLRSD